MRKKKLYQLSKFSVETIREGVKQFTDLLENGDIEYSTWTLGRGAEEWSFNSAEEFYAEYRRGFSSATVALQTSLYEMLFMHSDGPYYTSSSLAVTAPERQELEKVFWVFDRDAESSQIPTFTPPVDQPAPVIFIGHGRSPAWRDLKDHLAEQHGYTVQAYETGTRHGHTIRDILDELLHASSFALLVLTGEDLQQNGDVRARQNVVHELGLFQGKLGFARAIAVVEEGVELISNMDGVQQIRFTKGNIRQVYGDVLAVLRREFQDAR
ncbi:nucleotide-binding protein [Streptomyces griseoaurantiacus]|uniref:TIR domain-containing protein n=1 Tax=Streptomyces griseoaurantiacus TaxID=68213 RepID=UPI00352E17B2